MTFINFTFKCELFQYIKKTNINIVYKYKLVDAQHNLQSSTFGKFNVMNSGFNSQLWNIIFYFYFVNLFALLTLVLLKENVSYKNKLNKTIFYIFLFELYIFVKYNLFINFIVQSIYKWKHIGNLNLHLKIRRNEVTK